MPGMRIPGQREEPARSCVRADSAELRRSPSRTRALGAFARSGTLLAAVLGFSSSQCSDPCASAAAALEPCRAELDALPYQSLPGLAKSVGECDSEASRCLAGCVLMTSMSSCQYVVEAERWSIAPDPNALPLSSGALTFMRCTRGCLE